MAQPEGHGLSQDWQKFFGLSFFLFMTLEKEIVFLFDIKKEVYRITYTNIKMKLKFKSKFKQQDLGKCCHWQHFLA